MLKLATVRAVTAKAEYGAADSHFKKCQIAKKFFEEEMSHLIEEMKIAAKRLEELEECHCGKTLD